MSIPFTHLNSAQVALGGFREKVANPSLPASEKSANYYSTIHSARIALKPGTSAYQIALPVGVFLESIKVIATTAFSAGSAVEVGTAANGTDILPAEPLTAAGNTMYLPGNPAPAAQNSKNLMLYVTITGAPAAGAGFLVVNYSH